MTLVRDYFFLVMAFSVLLIPASQVQAQTQKVSLYTYHTHEPFITGENAGLSYDLAKLLTEISNNKYDIKVVATSRPRINKLIEGVSIGFVPWVNPAWFKDKDKNKYLWGDNALMEDANAILSHRELALNYNGPDSLKGLIFGGIKGHVYSDIDTYIKSGGNLRRVNADNHAQNMNKILGNDVDVMLMPLSSALYTIATEKLTNEFFVSPTPHSTYDRYNLIVNRNADLANFIDDALTSQAVTWKQILSNYQ